MGKQRRKFETGFKQQIVSEIESEALILAAGSVERPYFKVNATRAFYVSLNARDGDHCSDFEK
jgi:hypothetical protein